MKKYIFMCIIYICYATDNRIQIQDSSKLNSIKNLVVKNVRNLG